MRIKAIESLAELRSTDVLNDLKQLASEDPEEQVRKVAKQKVGELEKLLSVSAKKNQ